MSELRISQSFVGQKLRAHEIDVTARQTMNFAAGILDDSDCYFDDLRPEGIVAHPMQICALTWRMSSRLNDFLEGQRFPEEISKYQVHYTEKIFWKRAIRPGDRLTIEGQIAAMTPHRSGTHLIVRYDGRDSSGRPVFTEYTGALLRGVKCDEHGHSLESALPRDLLEGHDLSRELGSVDQSSALWQYPVQLHRLAAHLYDGCADISFPIHSSPSFAKSVGLPGIILHGTATTAIALTVLLRHEAGGDPRHLSRLDCKFTGMVFPGTQIQVRLHHRDQRTDEVRLFWSVADEQGRVAIADGILVMGVGQ